MSARWRKVARTNDPLTQDSARVTADALDALGRAKEAKELRSGMGSGDTPGSSVCRIDRPSPRHRVQ